MMSVQAINGESELELSLNFINTVEWRGRENPRDQLIKYKDVIDWGLQRRILDQDEYDRAFKECMSSPTETEKTYQRAVILREALYRVFSSFIEKTEPDSDDLTTLNEALSGALSHLRLGVVESSYRLIMMCESCMDIVTWRVAVSAVNLLTSDRLDRVKRCASEECGWFFLDVSKNKSRRWCDMNECGNRMKARRHYSLKKIAR